MLDTVHTIETPEGVALTLHIAGPVARILAWCVDATIRSAVYIALLMVLAQLAQFGMGVFLILLFLIEWFYPVIFEVYRDGATPGKRAMGIKVLQENGTPVSWSAALVRNLLRTVDFLPLFYGFGLASMLMSRRFQRLGDLAAGTLVVYEEQRRQAKKTEAEYPVATPLALPMPLQLEEQQAVVDFAERAQVLSKERQQELAGLVPALTGMYGHGAVERLFQFANDLLGRRTP